jgi:hypothetical protein
MASDGRGGALACYPLKKRRLTRYLPLTRLRSFGYKRHRSSPNRMRGFRKIRVIILSVQIRPQLYFG